MRAEQARWLWLCPAISIFFWTACGTPGVPQPPSLNLAKPVSDLRATRTGNQVTLTWTVPADTTDGAKFRHRGPTRVCRAIDEPNINQCAAIASLDTPTTQKTTSSVSEIPPQNVDPNDYVVYAVEVLNNRGRSAGLSNQVKIPTTAISRLDGIPKIQVTPDAVLVTATVAPRATAVPQILELLRKEKGTPQETTVAQRPLELQEREPANVELRDENFVWEKTYQYRVVLVGSEKLPDGNTVSFDADASSPIEILVHDVFPPAIPTGLQAVFSGQLPGQQPSIDLTWNPDLERDVAGYFVYRRNQDQPAAAAIKLNPQPVATPSFRDTAIQPGNTYVYSVSAIDQRGNESKRSQETSEQVPK
jgi:hypothetical protein